MPQTTALALWTANYPTLAKAQKPGNVVPSTTLWAHAVPNKPQWSGTAGALALNQRPAPADSAPVLPLRNNGKK